MAAGSVALPPGFREAPRLTSMLRAFSSGGSGAREPDLGALLAERNRRLAERRRQRADVSVSSAKGELVGLLFGSWDSAPRAAREQFDQLLAAVSRLLGGEASSEAVLAAALAAWRAGAPAAAAAGGAAAQGRGSLAALKGLRGALEGQFGPVDDASLQRLAHLLGSLLAWQAKLNPAAAAAAGGTAPEAACPGRGGAGKPAAGRPGPAAWAAYAAVELPRERVGAEEAVLAMCGLRPEEGAALLRGAVHEPPAVAPLPAARPPPRVVSEQESAAVEAEVFGTKGRVLNAEVGPRWLLDWCGRVLADGSAGDDTVPTAVCRMALTDKSDDELAAELFDLLGDAVFDAIGELLERRPTLIANIGGLIEDLKAAEEEDRGAAMPTYGTAVSVMSESQRLISKLERKAERRRGRQAAAASTGDDPVLAWLASHGLRELARVEEERATAHTRIKLGEGMEFRIGEGSQGLMTRGALPKGTTRKAYKGYEEVSVPAISPAVPPPDERLVQISELPEWAQLAFGGYKTLNRIQSRIFGVAFGSNENMLVCAPTGAGKTNIAMLAVLREVGAHLRPGGVINKADLKVVYVAPMKALAAEVTGSFSKRLAPLGLAVRELTGDMQLSKREMAETQMIVTTPEKWDVITRKGGEVAVASAVRLLIIDEVHLLNDERGPVIETLVARTTRQVEASQSMIRMVGLSATLPNYRDVARFLGVPATGLFHFDASYRPVPLELTFSGISERNFQARSQIMDEICYQKVADSLRRGFQAMVFVHSRKDTGKTARMLALKAQQAGEQALFDCSEGEAYPYVQKEVKKSRNREMAEVFESGLGIHHAGMLRPDRSLMERAFGAGQIKVLCCTATLAWGVNLPAHTVIIKGTQLYNPQKGGFTDLGMLDVQQIFGRAGRPQFQDTGEGIIITTHDKLAHYLSMLTHQVPIESQFTAGLVDHLNAEVVLGTVTNVREASRWLGYTYMHVRQTQNPLAYGIGWEELAADPSLEGHRRKLITEAARTLERCRMARFDEKSGNIYVTELGRVASHFYIRHTSVETYNERLKPHMGEADVLAMLALSSEFENLALREEEVPELDDLARDACPFDPRGGSDSRAGKANILLQAYISRVRMESFSLTADLNYVAQNAPRLARALFEICSHRGWSSAADLCLTLSKAFEKRLWPEQHPLCQFEGPSGLKFELLRKLEERGLTLDRLQDMDASEIGSVLRHPAAGPQIAVLVGSFPALALEASLSPITRTVLRISLTITPTFAWRDNVHGSGLKWFIWVEDSDNEHIYHQEAWVLTKKAHREGPQHLSFTVPIFEPLPPQYYVRAVSDSWLGAEALLAVSFKGLALPDRHPPHTELLDLDPLPVAALGNPRYESLYRFSHFNPIQTQAFHVLYHSDSSVLLGAPTGSGKTISAELAMLRLFTAHPGRKAIYIAPLKALVRERMKDWGAGFCRTLGKRLVELTGDYTPDLHALLSADIIVATPEKWDGISRHWQNRAYVKKVGLLVMDEIHLLGADRGPTLEVIVSRMRYVAAAAGEGAVRFVGLSTALANAADLADWLGVPKQGLFNFRPSVRPVPLEVHIQGYPGRFYCPRMAAMNKPAYAAIATHSPLKPVLIFVSSRRQTRLTALDLIAHAAADERPRAFLRCSDAELDQSLALVKDDSLRHTLGFGIGLHHAGLADGDRGVVERLFVEGKIQVLVATSTLAWGVNTPAHLVVIKGTEFYDAPSKRYVDYPITDVLQMMGRAGRPQYDRHGVAVVMVHEPKKSFYKKFLYEPFPVESSLPAQLADHLNAEVAAGSVCSRQDAVDWLTWTFLVRRLLRNPSYYGLEPAAAEEDEEGKPRSLQESRPGDAALAAHLSGLVEDALAELEAAGCVELPDEGSVAPLTPGRIASLYYLRHATMRVFADTLCSDMGVQALLGALCAAAEYDELPVRHNEDRLNATLAGQVRWHLDTRAADDPHMKANLLLQAHMGRLPLPITDYITDTKSVLDNSLRILQALVDIAADKGWLETALSAMRLVQALMQGRWHDDPTLLWLPHLAAHGVQALEASGLGELRVLLQQYRASRQQVAGVLDGALGKAEACEVASVLDRLPLVAVSWAPPTPQRPSTGPSEDGGGAGPAYTLEVTLQRQHGKGARHAPPRVYAPHFPKVKEEGWWLLLGCRAAGELHAVRRTSFGQRTTVKLSFAPPSGTESLDLLLVSDSYLGLDQQFTVPLGAN